MKEENKEVYINPCRGCEFDGIEGPCEHDGRCNN